MNTYIPSLLRCPVCGGTMTLFPGSPPRVVCERKHSFDVSRWINFLTRPVTAHYSQSLFAARRRIWESGLFDPLSTALAGYLGPGTTLLDAGCGEGSPLLRIRAGLPPESGPLSAVGIDLAKDGIRMATAGAKDICWLVGDLTRLPLIDSAFDVILNLLSPACYEEFARVLKPGGLLIKVVPEEGYLQEIRRLLPEETQSLHTPREALLHRPRGYFEPVSSRRLTYRAPVPAGCLFELVRMTPLCAPFTDEQCLELSRELGGQISVDLTIHLFKNMK